MTATQRFLDGLMWILRESGYDCKLNGNEIDIAKNGIDIMSLRASGDYKPHQSNIGECVSEIRRLHQQTQEAYRLYNKSAQVEYENLSHYRKLADHNGVILAARLRHDNVLEFATWERKYINHPKSMGNYFEGYYHAKEDFAVRAGLIDRNKMFDETEMKLIRHGLVYLGANFPDLTAEQNTLLGKVVEKIEMLVPEIREREELERDNLVPDDGLEV